MFLATGGAGRAHGPSLPLPFKKKLGLINISSSKSEISNLFFLIHRKNFLPPT
jgi:hypothetical protein